MNWKTVYPLLNKSAEKYSFYDGNYSYEDFDNGSLGTRFKSHIGWARRAIDMRANKTHFDTFENDTIGLKDIYDEFAVGDALDMIMKDIPICGVGFLALAGDRVMPFTAEEATGTYSWYTSNLKSGFAMFRQNVKGNSLTNEPLSYMQFDADKTITVDDGNKTVAVNKTGRPLIGMLTHHATTKQPFGYSAIPKTAREAIISASRTVRQMEIAGYHYNMKVNVILGVDNESQPKKVEMKSGEALLVSPNEDGQIPQIGQFAQHAMAPFNDEILSFAKNFCADTKLNLANLGMSTSAPQSAEALDIVSDDLSDDITEWQNEMGRQLKYFVVTLWMLKNGVSSIDSNLAAKIRAIKPVWKPMFRVDVAKVGDGINKVAQLEKSVLTTRSIWRELGFDSKDIDTIVTNANNSSL